MAITWIEQQKYTPILKMPSMGFAALMGIGFASFPILFYVAKMMGTDLLNWTCNSLKTNFRITIRYEHT